MSGVPGGGGGPAAAAWDAPPGWTLDDLHADPGLRRREFPVTASGIFMAHAGVTALPARVTAACAGHLATAAVTDQEEALPAGWLTELRRAAADVIGPGVDPGEVALVGPTSTALSYVAAGMDWSPGDEVVTYFDDYPSNVYPWMALRERGVIVRFVESAVPGRITLEGVAAAITSRTRLVALASAHYLSGWRLDVAGIGEWLRQREVAFCVDGIQTLGAYPTPAASADFLAADAHKWLLGPAGAGILYVRRGMQDRLRPVVHGWNNIRCPGFLTQRELVWRGDARRYEAGTLPLLPLVGLGAALALVRYVGLEAISTQVTALRARLASGLAGMGFAVVEPDPPPGRCAGMVSFHCEGRDMAPLDRWLRANRVTGSLRNLPGGWPCCRLSPHFYNTAAEVDRVLELVSDWVARGGGAAAGQDAG